MRCKYGKLKNPTGGRRCKKAPKAKAKSGLKGGPSCRYGKLKNPIGGRVCKKRPGGKR